VCQTRLKLSRTVNECKPLLSGGDGDEEMDGPWNMSLNRERPPTPPRGRGGSIDGGSPPGTRPALAFF